MERPSDWSDATLPRVPFRSVPRRSAPFRAFRGIPFRGSPQPLVIVHNSVLLLSSVSPSLSQSNASILGEPSGWPRADAEQRHHSSAATVPDSFSRTAVRLSRCSFTHTAAHTDSLLLTAAPRLPTVAGRSVGSPLIAAGLTPQLHSTHPTRRVDLHSVADSTHSSRTRSTPPSCRTPLLQLRRLRALALAPVRLLRPLGLITPLRPPPLRIRAAASSSRSGSFQHQFTSPFGLVGVDS